MKFGLWYDFRNPPQWRRPYPDLYAQLLEQIRAAEDLGYASVWLSEHHFVEDGYCPSLMPLAAAVAAKTQRITIGTSVLLLPLHHPVRIAEDAAIVDILSNGRLILGVGQGYRLGEFQGLGVNRRHRAALVEEGVAIIKGLWTEDNFSFSGRHYKVTNLSLTPKPVQKPRPPIYLGATSEQGARRAARIGDGFVGVGRRAQQVYLATLKEMGRDPQQYPIVASLNLFVSQDPEQSWHQLKEHALYQTNEYARWAAEPEPFQPVTDAEDLRRGRRYLVVDPDTCVKIVEDYSRDSGSQHIYFWAVWPGVDPDLAWSSVELFARKVMPHFRQD